MYRFLSLLLLATTAVNAQSVEWRSKLSSPSSVHQVYVADDYIFAQNSQSLLSLNPKSGNPHIEFKQGNTPPSPPVQLQAFESRSTTHYVLSFHENGDVTAFDTRLDELMWTLHKIAAPPVVDQEHGVGIYMLTQAGQLLAVDSMSRFPVFSVDHSMPTATSTLHLSLDNEHLYILNSNGQVQIHSAIDGTLLSSISPYEGKEKTMDQAIIVGDVLYVSKDDVISAHPLLDENDSAMTLLWSISTLGQLYSVKTMGDSKHALLLTSTGLHKVNGSSGKLKWTVALEEGEDIVSFTTNDDDDVYIVLESDFSSSLVKLNGITGGKEWVFSEPQEDILGEVKVHNDAVYIITQDENDNVSASLPVLVKLRDNIDVETGVSQS